MNKALFPLITEEESSLPFYVKSVGGRQNQEHVFRPDGYSDYHWLHCVKGRGKLIIAGNEYMISESMGFFFCPGIPHEYFSVNDPWETHWVTFDGYAVPQLLNLLGFVRYGVFYISDLHRLERTLNDIYLSAQSLSPVKGFECSSFLYKFLIELRSCIIGTGDSYAKSLKYKHLQPIISYIEGNFYKPLCLEELASIIDVTPQHLCRLFKQVFNMRPFEYLTGYRIKKAKELIIESLSSSIKDIARSVGYNDASYFCALFKEYEGITPLEFKKMHGTF